MHATYISLTDGDDHTLISMLFAIDYITRKHRYIKWVIESAPAKLSYNFSF